jgi:1,4-dihydroxy-2-naphthoate octaprenyltransferase
MANINPNSKEIENVSKDEQKTSNEKIGYAKRWSTVLGTCNFSNDVDKQDLISRWLVIVRACVFSMTITSGLIGGFLALFAARMSGVSELNWLNFILATFALVLAHAVNNMLNDYFDYKTGVDDSEYARAIYAPHPILSGLTSEKGLLTSVLLFNILFIAISIYFAITVDILVLVFAILGLFLSIAYVSPPFNFKRRGLGEISVFLVWGPLMIGIVFFVTFGQILDFLWLATVPYAITVTTVIMGKHIDKYESDKEKGVHTLPVILGEKFTRMINQLLLILFYILTLYLVIFDILGIGILLVLLAIPRLIRVLNYHNKPKPAEPPEDWNVWPLWLVGWSFWHNKLAGGLFILGLIINLLLPVEFLYFSNLISLF